MKPRDEHSHAVRGCLLQEWPKMRAVLFVCDNLTQ